MAPHNTYNNHTAYYQNASFCAANVVFPQFGIGGGPHSTIALVLSVISDDRQTDRHNRC